jgi:hypothetical protein
MTTYKLLLTVIRYIDSRTRHGNTKLTDVSEVIEKLSPILKSVKDQGFTIKELEIESSGKDHDKHKVDE